MKIAKLHAEASATAKGRDWGEQKEEPISGKAQIGAVGLTSVEELKKKIEELEMSVALNRARETLNSQPEYRVGWRLCKIQTR